MRAQGGRYEPGLAPLSLSRSVSTLLESDSASHMDTKARLRQLPTKRRSPDTGGRYAVITWWLCIVVYACLGGLACLTRQGGLNPPPRLDHRTDFDGEPDRDRRSRQGRGWQDDPRLRAGLPAPSAFGRS